MNILSGENQSEPKCKKLLYGICGIGNGHINRQLPIINHFAANNDIVIFAYGESYKFFSRHFAIHPMVSVQRVAVPYLAGGRSGIDFQASAARPENLNQNFEAINYRAMDEAEKLIGKPDLVISDYEPICAQYAYAYNAPLVTIDQQSKYLHGNFPDIDGQSCRDEIMRLRMFFPKADQRIATSFFGVKPKPKPDEMVEMYPAILKDQIVNLRKSFAGRANEILVYLSSQQAVEQSLAEIGDICGAQKNAVFNIFAPTNALKGNDVEPNSRVKVYPHGDSAFYSVLQSSNAIITTAGHTLMSEAMHLNMPVYAMPFALYEQQMHAQIITQNGFGVSHHSVDGKVLADFIERIPQFTKAIEEDSETLLRGPSQQAIIESIEKRFLK